MNEQYARQMVKEIDEARQVIAVLDALERIKTSERWQFGYRGYSLAGSCITGVNVPDQLKEEIFKMLRNYVENVLDKYGVVS